MGSKGKRSVKGLSVQAMGNEKHDYRDDRHCRRRAAAVTGAATANVISSTTEASIGKGAQINMSGALGVDSSVCGRGRQYVHGADGWHDQWCRRCRVSGTANTAIVTKTTSASIGDADVKANHVEVAADASEKLYSVTANVSIAEAAGVGMAVGVDVVTNTTTSSTAPGANIDATGDVKVHAEQDTAVDLSTVAGAGGIAGVSGAVSVAWSTIRPGRMPKAPHCRNAATRNAGGTTEVSADSKKTSPV